MDSRREEDFYTKSVIYKGRGGEERGGERERVGGGERGKRRGGRGKEKGEREGGSKMFG